VVRLSSIGSSGPNVDYLAVLKAGEAEKQPRPKPQVQEPPASRKPLLAKETWHHVAVSVSGEKAVFYLDGSRLRTDPFSAADFAADAAFFLGPRFRSSPFELDEFRLYSRSLSEAEVKELLKR